MSRTHASTQPTSRGPNAWACLAALTVGAVVIAIYPGKERWTVGQLAPFLAAALLMLVPRARVFVAGVVARLRNQSVRAAWWTALGVAVVAFIVLILPVVLGEDAPFPGSHDAQTYLIQARLLARGALWLPPHPVGDFFETFFILSGPVYTPIYFPGTALLYVPMVWLEQVATPPYWLLPAVYGALAVGLMYRVMTALLDGWYGLLGAALLLSSTLFRWMALSVIAHPVMMLLGIACIGAFLAWRAKPTAWRAGLAGAVGGLAAITRPADALCYVLPLALAALGPWLALPLKRRSVQLLAALACAAPFIGLQIVHNLGVTGRLFQSPYVYYLERDQPGTTFGFSSPEPEHDYADAWPESRLLQKHLYYSQFIRPTVQRHTPEKLAETFATQRLPMILSNGLPHPLLILLLPVSVLGLSDRRRLAVWAVLPLLVVAYTLNPFLLSHYLVVWLPALIGWVLIGARAIEQSWEAHHAGSIDSPIGAASTSRTVAASAIGLFLLAAGISAQPGIRPDVSPPWSAPLLSAVNNTLASLPDKPAVVLFRYFPGNSLFEEPVYNVDVAWPDDAPVIRAQDLGPERNIEIVRYYAKMQPGRYFYLYDLEAGAIHPLGRADQLFQKMRAIREDGTSGATPASLPTSKSAN